MVSVKQHADYIISLPALVKSQQAPYFIDVEQRTVRLKGRNCQKKSKNCFGLYLNARFRQTNEIKENTREKISAIRGIRTDIFAPTNLSVALY